MSYVTCDRCDGRGQLDCPKCDVWYGSRGQLFDPLRPLSGGEIWEDCDHCDGTGYIDCPDCRGSGEVKEEDE